MGTSTSHFETNINKFQKKATDCIFLFPIGYFPESNYLCILIGLPSWKFPEPPSLLHVYLRLLDLSTPVNNAYQYRMKEVADSKRHQWRGFLMCTKSTRYLYYTAIFTLQNRILMKFVILLDCINGRSICASHSFYACVFGDYLWQKDLSNKPIKLKDSWCFKFRNLNFSTHSTFDLFSRYLCNRLQI